MHFCDAEKFIKNGWFPISIYKRLKFIFQYHKEVYESVGIPIYFNKKYEFLDIGHPLKKIL